MIPLAAIVTVGCVVAAAVVVRQVRRWEREEADARAAAVIDSAERIVRLAEARRQHPSTGGGL